MSGYTIYVKKRRDGWLKCSIALGLLLLAIGCGGGGSTPIVIPDEISVNYPAANEAVERYNLYRSLTHVPPIELDAYLSLGCQYHAYYLAINNIDLRDAELTAHSEDPDLPGYTSHGDYAGRSSIIYQGVTPVEAIDNWFRTFYHRLGLLDPNLHYIGFGSLSEYQILDMLSGRVTGPIAVSSYVHYPSSEMTNVPVDYKREIPHPIPSDDSLGIPITVEFFGSSGLHIVRVESQVTDLDTGTLIDCYRQLPDEPFLADWSRDQLIALIPHDPLPSGHTFRVSINAMVDGENWSEEWEFSTR